MSDEPNQNGVTTPVPRPSRTMSLHAAGKMLLALAIGLAGALIFRALDAPLPWMLGSTAACFIVTILGGPILPPKPVVTPLRATLGVAIGTAFSPELIGRIPGMLASLGVLVPYVALLVLIGVPFFERLARFDRPTAFFSAVPGGLNDMVLFAEQSGANERTVTLVHCTRVLIIVFTLPFLIVYLSGLSPGEGTLASATLADLSWFDGVVLCAIGVIGRWLALRLGIFGAAMVGPMLLSGLLHAAGFTSARVPTEIMSLAQLGLGTYLGCLFRGLTAREFSSVVAWAICYSGIILTIAAAFSLLVVWLTGFDLTSVFLAFSPGGQPEMNLMAFVLGLDVAYVALHHLVRVAIVLLGAQIVLLKNKDWRGPAGRDSDPRPPERT